MNQMLFSDILLVGKDNGDTKIRTKSNDFSDNAGFGVLIRISSERDL